MARLKKTMTRTIILSPTAGLGRCGGLTAIFKMSRLAGAAEFRISTAHRIAGDR
jgi:hypothetical protein